MLLHFPSISEDEFRQGCQVFSDCASPASSATPKVTPATPEEAETAEAARHQSSPFVLVSILSGILTLQKEYPIAQFTPYASFHEIENDCGGVEEVKEGEEDEDDDDDEVCTSSMPAHISLPY
jgi:hypothetical protein